MSSYVVRSYRPEDRNAVRAIAYGTALEGGSIEAQYRDQESFADMFTAPYTDHEPENVLVVEQNGQVEGYTCAALDTKRARSPQFYALKHGLLRLVWLRPGTARFYFRAFWDTLRDLGAPKKPVMDPARYPSHAHINLSANVRGAGVAMELLTRLFEQMIARGSKGIYAECVSSNKAIAAVARKLGFVAVGVPYPAPGIRDSEGKRVSIQLFALDLEAWAHKRSSGASTANVSPPRRDNARAS